MAKKTKKEQTEYDALREIVRDEVIHFYEDARAKELTPEEERDFEFACGVAAQSLWALGYRKNKL